MKINILYFKKDMNNNLMKKYKIKYINEYINNKIKNLEYS